MATREIMFNPDHMIDITNDMVKKEELDKAIEEQKLALSKDITGLNTKIDQNIYEIKTGVEKYINNDLAYKDQLKSYLDNTDEKISMNKNDNEALKKAIEKMDEYQILTEKRMTRIMFIMALLFFVCAVHISIIITLLTHWNWQ